MHSLIVEIAKRLELQPNEVAEAVDMIFVRVRAELETVGQAEIEGLGTFRSVDGEVTFEPSVEFANEVNKEFAGMQAVALTATGESVAVDDSRALPGTTSESGDGASDPEQSVEGDVMEDLSAAVEEKVEDIPEDTPESVEPVESVTETVEPKATSTFTSPPPPIPSKVRIPPKERREAERAESAKKEAAGIPDMGPIVSTRPVEPIHTGVPKRSRSRMPLMGAVAVIAIAVASWLIWGTSGSEPEMEVVVADASPRPATNQVPLTESNPPADVVEEATDEVQSKVADPPIEDVTQVVAEEVVEEAAPTVAPAPEVEAVTETVVSTPTPPAAGPVYVWIVSSSPSEAESQARVDALNESGFDARIYQATVRGAPAFRVGIGQFASEVDALQNRASVPPEITDAWVTRVK